MDTTIHSSFITSRKKHNLIAAYRHHCNTSITTQVRLKTGPKTQLQKRTAKVTDNSLVALQAFMRRSSAETAETSATLPHTRLQHPNLCEDAVAVVHWSRQVPDRAAASVAAT